MPDVASLLDEGVGAGGWGGPLAWLRAAHADFGAGQFQGSAIGIPYLVVAGSQSTVPINFTAYGDESDPGPMPLPEKSNVMAVSPLFASVCARYGKNAQCANPLKPWQTITVPSDDAAG